MYNIIIYSEMLENLKVAEELMNDAVRIDVEENEEKEDICDKLEPAFNVIDKCIKKLQTKLNGFEEELCLTENKSKR